MSTRRLATTTDDRAVAIRRYRNGERPDEIAAALDEDLETVSQYIRDAGDLAPWDDHRALAHLYAEYQSVTALVELFDGQRSTEAIRTRMDHLGVDRHDSIEDRLLAMDPGEIDGLSPLSDDEFVTPETDGQQTLDSFDGGSA